jgi:chromosome segregation ATPase
MTPSLVAVDRESVEHSFREWQEEQSLLDAQLAESVAALDSYQSHLDNWQQELAREREELRLLREAVERDRVAGSAGNEQIEVLHQELRESREKISTLTTALQTRTEELCELERRRESLELELAMVRVREKELEATVAAHESDSDTQTHHGSQHQAAFAAAVEQAAATNQVEAVKNGTAKVEPRRGASPVLGSVMEQFGKLREQRSLNRANNKAR